MQEPLNEMLVGLDDRHTGNYAIFSGDREFWVDCYDAQSNLGIARLYTTRYAVAFSVIGEGKPTACGIPTTAVRLFEIDTVAIDGGIAAALGKTIKGSWRVATRYLRAL